MNSGTFDELYKGLNLEQKRAVDAIEGPVMVIAGPGTGKTQILTLRIANIIQKTDVGPDSILALTFTESGAYAMRKRLVSIIGSVAYRINIFTFHGFCNEVIKTYPEEFPRIIGANSVTEIDQISILEEIILSHDLEKLKPYGDPLYYLRPALHEIKNLKREDINPDEFKKLITSQEKHFKSIDDLYYDKGQHKGKMKGKYKDLEKDIEKNKDLLNIYKAYEAKLEEKRLFDFEDMIMEVVRVLKTNQDLLLRLQEKYQYILADEHQDANQGQNHILELLSGFFESPNLFIVGDEKQAIYRFQGASLENFLYFKKLYPSAEIINLVNNYRSTQAILDGAHTLISKNILEDASLRVELKAAKESLSQKINVLSFTKEEHEYQYILHDIEKKIQAGVLPQEICVLFRDNKDVFPLIKTFEKSTVPFSVESGQNVLDDEDIAKLIRILKAVNEIGNTVLFTELLFIDFLGIDHLDVYKMLQYARKEKISLYALVSSEEHREQSGIDNKKNIVDVYNKLASWSKLAKNKNIVDFFEIIVRESGFLDYILARPGAMDILSKLEVFFNDIKTVAGNHKEYRLHDLVTYITTLVEHKVLIKINVSGDHAHGVRLMTAHRSKGQEFEYVYIVGATYGHWCNKRSISHFHIPVLGRDQEAYDPIDDERRLFYVAITRAKKEVMISWSKETTSKKDQLPSQFIEELGDVRTEIIDDESFDRAFSFLPRLNAGLDIKDRAFLQKLFLEQGMSVSALNNYLKCPWNYFFENLVRIPRPQSKYQLYGTAVHEALKVFFDKYKKEEDISKEELLILFESFLKRKPLEQTDYEASLIKGRESLAGYYDMYKQQWPRALINEFTITGVEVPFSAGTLLLRGQLDKIELGEGNAATVIDYKTRKPMSRNEIEGMTKTGTGDYKRQLVFYKKLLQDQYAMHTGIIDFIEPDESGRYKREAFEITSNDVEELTVLIKKTAEEIYNFTFWDVTCKDILCEYCRLRKLLEK